jgi:hypothetical protein
VQLPLGQLHGYHAHMAQMAEGYVKDPTTREEQVRIVRGWQSDAERLAVLLRP